MTNKIIQFTRESPTIFETPCYVYDVEQVMRNYLDLKYALGTKLIVSLKANSNRDLKARCSHIFEDGYEVASVQELLKVLSGGGPRLIYNPSADESLLSKAVATGSTVIVDNKKQLDFLISKKKSHSIKPILFRLNTSSLHQFDSSINVFANDHFGSDWSSILDMAQHASNHQLEVFGFTLFLGSFHFEKMGLQVAKVVPRLIEIYEKKLGFQLKVLGLGGGFNSNFRTFDFSQYRHSLRDIPSYVSVYHESGRAIFESAGCFLSRVVATKSIQGRTYVICDGGMAQNFLLCQTEQKFKRSYDQPEFVNLDTDRETLIHDALITGSSCNRNDIIGRISSGQALPKTGDLCVFRNCGAYNFSYSVDRFLSLPSAKEYILP